MGWKKLGVAVVESALRRPNSKVCGAFAAASDCAIGWFQSGRGNKTASAFFSGQDLHYQDETFTGATYTAVFGGVIANLRNVTLTGDVVITVSALFGGIDIILPDNVRVVTHVAPILGGTECKYVSSRDPLSPCVIVRGSATFGGVTIK